MLLFSTIFDIDDSMSKDIFVQLVISWNQKSPHSENVIKNIQWNGERNIRYGNENLWLDIEEYRNKNIIAVRYEKIEKDGVIWDTDIIMNFNEMRMAVQLDRSFKEDALKIKPDFSTPYFITRLIEGGYIKADDVLPVLKEPIYITDENLEILSEIVNEKKRYRLPIVYISKTMYNSDPVNVNGMSNRLKGVADVLVESDVQLNYKLRKMCDDKNEYNGSIGIYYPTPVIRHKRFFYRRCVGNESALLDKVVVSVIEYENSQNIECLYTWQGVANSILMDKLIAQREERLAAECAKQNAENEMDEVYDTFDEDLSKLQQEVKDLTKANEALRIENQGLRTKLDATDVVSILNYGNEDDFYPGEIKDIILSVLDETLRKFPDSSRKTDILRDIIDNNNFERLSEEKKTRIKTLFRAYTGMTGTVRQQIRDLGFEITESGKHYKLIYFGDDRYWTTLGKTPSDGRNGKNVALEIIKEMF